MMLLEGKKAVVTGGSRGLGRAFCVRFAQEGADVAFNFSSDEQGAAETAKAVEAHGRRAMAVKASVVDEKAMDALAARVEKEWGGADILVNNAGISQPLPIALMEGSDWDTVMDVNVKGAFLATRALARGMVRRKKGAILNIGSLAGERAIESPVHYAASKAAMRGFTEALCKEFSRHGIRVNCLAPGLLDEGVGKNLPDHRLAEYVKHVPLGRIGTVDEVAAFAAFLVSDRNAYMNGETVLMDGGL
ncbi:MAG: SDR family oxidoreductase [Elusimicrobia bacterium]|nr:SDR family oxidoreductase [Elusimicrobiota bacterium]